MISNDEIVRGIETLLEDVPDSNSNPVANNVTKPNTFRRGLVTNSPFGVKMTKTVIDHHPPSKLNRRSKTRSSCFGRGRPSSDGYCTSSSVKRYNSEVSNDNLSGGLLTDMMSNLHFNHPNKCHMTEPNYNFSMYNGMRGDKLSSYFDDSMHPNVFGRKLRQSVASIKDGLGVNSSFSEHNGMGASRGLDHSLKCKSSFIPLSSPDSFNLEKAARMHRSATVMYDPGCTWSGVLPLKEYRNPNYSCKVFLGGVPWDITEKELMESFWPFGPLKIDWPGKGNAPNPLKGYAYILFNEESQVKALMKACYYSFNSNGRWSYKITSRRMTGKGVEVIPWVITDSDFVKSPASTVDNSKSVFVGALRGMVTAEDLAVIMEDLFGEVVYAGIDTDMHKYPVGSGRVTFRNVSSFCNAVKTACIKIKTIKLNMTVQVDPYLRNAKCSECGKPAPYFCRYFECFKYFCNSCWRWRHAIVTLRHHRPFVRNRKLRSVANTYRNMTMQDMPNMYSIGPKLENGMDNIRQ